MKRLRWKWRTFRVRLARRILPPNAGIIDLGPFVRGMTELAAAVRKTERRRCGSCGRDWRGHHECGGIWQRETTPPLHRPKPPGAAS